MTKEGKIIFAFYVYEKNKRHAMAIGRVIQRGEEERQRGESWGWKNWRMRHERMLIL